MRGRPEANAEDPLLSVSFLHTLEEYKLRGFAASPGLAQGCTESAHPKLYNLRSDDSSAEREVPKSSILLLNVKMPELAEEEEGTGA